MTKENELLPYTFKDSGEKIHIRRVSPLLLMEFGRAYEKQHPKPKPPMNTVDYGDGPRQEENPASPEYQAELLAYNIAMERATRFFMIKRGVVCDVPTERIAQLRADWMQSVGEELAEKDDLLAYISYICIATPDDLMDFTTALTRRSQATEAAIAENLSSFRG